MKVLFKVMKAIVKGILIVLGVWVVLGATIASIGGKETGRSFKEVWKDYFKSSAEGTQGDLLQEYYEGFDRWAKKRKEES